jgi:Na+/proline symporter
MADPIPFIDRETGGLDTDQIRAEAYPLAGLIALFAGLALIPFVIVFMVGGNSFIGLLFTVLGQLIIAVGAGIVLIYVIARGIRLAEA